MRSCRPLHPGDATAGPTPTEGVSIGAVVVKPVQQEEAVIAQCRVHPSGGVPLGHDDHVPFRVVRTLRLNAGRTRVEHREDVDGRQRRTDVGRLCHGTHRDSRNACSSGKTSGVSRVRSPGRRCCRFADSPWRSDHGCMVAKAVRGVVITTLCCWGCKPLRNRESGRRSGDSARWYSTVLRNASSVPSLGDQPSDMSFVTSGVADVTAGLVSSDHRNGGWFREASNDSKRLAGDLPSRVMRGRLLSSLSTRARSLLLCLDRSVDFGKY